jgi:hypothetical protein
MLMLSRSKQKLGSFCDAILSRLSASFSSYGSMTRLLKNRTTLRHEFQRYTDVLAVFERFSDTLIGIEEKQHRLGLVPVAAKKLKLDPTKVTANLGKGLLPWARPTLANFLAN